MKKALLFSLLVALAVCGFYFGSSFYFGAADAGTDVGGLIISDTTWIQTNSPYRVVADVVVAQAATLTIEPGVIVKFLGGISLIVDGGLIADGNSTHKITFTSEASSPKPGDWGNISIRKSGFCSITNSIIEYATNGLYFNALYEYSSRNSVFVENHVRSNIAGVNTNGARMGTFRDLIIENNTDFGINDGDIADSLIINNNRGIIGSVSTINNCTVANNTNVGITSHGFDLHNSQITNNGGNGVSGGYERMSNTLISNNSGDGLVVSFWERVDISNCTITFNKGDGIRGGYVVMTQSIISGNSGTGVDAVDTDISYCSITDNNIGLLSTGTYYMPYYGHNRDIHYCNLYNNSLYDVKNIGTNLNANYNWWGTSNESDIDSCLRLL